MLLKINTLLILFAFFDLIMSWKMRALDALQREMFTLRSEIKIQHFLIDIGDKQDAEEADIKKDLDANRQKKINEGEEEIMHESNLVQVINTEHSPEEYDNLLKVLTKELMAIKIPFGSKKDIEIMKRLELFILVKFGYFTNCFWNVPHPAFLQNPNYQCDQSQLGKVLKNCFDVEVRKGELRELIDEDALSKAYSDTPPNYRGLRKQC